MSKLPESHQFTDLSDYGRPVARWIALTLKDTPITPIYVTLSFVLTGLLAITCILKGWYMAAALLLVLKSILDAADGDLARVKNTPSMTGRYFDSISDILLNLLFLLVIGSITQTWIFYTLLAFIGMQLQGTLYNYYYVILRFQAHGDQTSRIFEREVPKALPGESQKTVTLFYYCYKLLYGIFDEIIYALDRNASKGTVFPSWFMTALSTFGLGFQLLLIGIFLVAGWAAWIIPFFIAYTLMIPVFILIRKLIL